MVTAAAATFFMDGCLATAGRCLTTHNTDLFCCRLTAQRDDLHTLRVRSAAVAIHHIRNDRQSIQRGRLRFRLNWITTLESILWSPAST